MPESTAEPAGKCACGWKLPAHIRIFGLTFPPLTITFDCPECGRTFDKLWTSVDRDRKKR